MAFPISSAHLSQTLSTQLLSLRRTQTSREFGICDVGGQRMVRSSAFLVRFRHCDSVSCINDGMEKFKNLISVMPITVQVSCAVPFFGPTAWSVPTAEAVPYHLIPKCQTGELTLRKAIPANPNMKTIQAGWKLWPFAHLITYGVVPLEQRLLWVDTVELIWVTILATYSNENFEARI